MSKSREAIELSSRTEISRERRSKNNDGWAFNEKPRHASDVVT